MVKDEIRGSARRLSQWCGLLLLFLLAVLVLEIAARAGAFDDWRGSHRLGLDLLFAIPVLLDLLALWRVREALRTIAGGALFTPVLARAVRQVGTLLALAAACTMVLAPLLHHLAKDAYPRSIEFDVANLVLGAVGIALIFLARLFEVAVELQREMDEIF